MSANQISSEGLTIQTHDEIVDEILNGAPATLTTAAYPGMYQIYGADINVAPNSPDGQMINIVAQAKLDMLEFIQQAYTSFDPDQAVGVQLDQRCAINGVKRKAGTYTTTNVSVLVNQVITLPGLDTAPTNPFTVSDSSGNQYQLVNSYAFASTGTVSLAFRSKVIGPITPSVNTITNIVTITLGVVSVNNPTVPTLIGTAEESDYVLRIRRSGSVALPSKGYLQGLYAGLTQLEGVTSAAVFENTTGTTDSNGVPGHSIWCIIAGGTNEEIANMIYTKRNAGCGMKGSVSVTISQVDNSTFIVKFDRPTAEDLYISLDVAAITGTVDDAFIRSQLLAQLSYSIDQSADTTTIVSIVKAVAPNASVSNEGVSDDDITYVPLLAPTGVNYQFELTASRIIINGVPG